MPPSLLQHRLWVLEAVLAGQESKKKKIPLKQEKKEEEDPDSANKMPQSLAAGPVILIHNSQV